MRSKSLRKKRNKKIIKKRSYRVRNNYKINDSKGAQRGVRKGKRRTKRAKRNKRVKKRQNKKHLGGSLSPMDPEDYEEWSKMTEWFLFEYIQGYIDKPGGVYVLDSSLRALSEKYGGEVKTFETGGEFMEALGDVNRNRGEQISNNEFIRHFNNYIKKDEIKQRSL